MLRICCREFGPPEQLERLQAQIPEPKLDEALIEVRAAGVGFVDGLMIQGLYQVKAALPFYPGSEFSGVVTAIGAEVTNVKLGDRVLGSASSGAFADFLCIRASGLVKIPQSLDDATAAGLYINYATALYGLRDRGNLQPGETILILGAAGGVGSAAISVAKAMGATVIAAASSEAKRAAALSYGADEAIDYTASDWRDAIKEKTTNGGLNLVYDPVGGDFAEPAFRSLSPGGRFLVVGFASGTIPRIALNLALLKRSAIIGVDWGGESRAHPELNNKLMDTLMCWIAEDKLRPAAVSTRPMQDYAQALTDQLAGKIIGKLVLTN
jgi:NADPH2:quinone reductase